MAPSRMARSRKACSRMARRGLNRKIVTTAAVLAAFAGVALAQPTPIRPADRNAALAYSTLFYTDLTRELTDAVEAVDLAAIGADAAAVNDAYTKAAEQVRSREGLVRRVMEVSRLSKCDFEIAYEEGFNALLPHLGSMRKTARIVRLDARRMLLEGQPDEAAQRIATLYRMSGHLKNDSVLISSLVSAAVSGMANAEAEVLAQSGKLTAVGRETIVAAAEGLGRIDPYGVKAAVQGERWITSKWIRESFPGPGAGAKFVKTLKEEWGIADGQRPELEQIATLDPAGFSKALDQVDQYHALIHAMWELPDAAERLIVIASRVKAGEFGPFTALLAPDLHKARQAQTKAEGELHATHGRLKKYTPPAANPK